MHKLFNYTLIIFKYKNASKKPACTIFFIREKNIWLVGDASSYFFYKQFAKKKNKGRLGGPSREGPGMDPNEMG
jgi:hypothetical protein